MGDIVRKVCLVVLVMVVALMPVLSLSEAKESATETRPAGGDEKKAVRTDTPAQPAPQPASTQYRPPKTGAPGGRVGGGTRGADPNLVALFVLAPDHVAATIKDDPDFYWYISAPPKYPVEFTFSEDQGVQPLVQTRISPPVKAGLNRIKLKDYGVKLSKGVQYRWFMALVPDENRRSKDLVAGAMIERIDMPGGLKEKLASAGEGNEWPLYAQEGVWYDAIMALSEQIAAKPGDQGLRAQRDSLLDQVGLPRIGDAK